MPHIHRLTWNVIAPRGGPQTGRAQRPGAELAFADTALAAAKRRSEDTGSITAEVPITEIGMVVFSGAIAIGPVGETLSAGGRTMGASA